MRFVTIGTSGITREFVAAAKNAGAEYVGAYSRDISRARAFAGDFGGSLCFDDLGSLAACGDADPVYVASPNALHARQSRLMLEAGKHVICEKPAATDPAELRGLQELADKKGVIYVEAIMSLHSPGLAALKKAMGRVGEISFAHIDFSQLSSRYALLKNGEMTNIFSQEMQAGCLEDIGLYCVYLTLELFGKPDRIVSKSVFLPSAADGRGCALVEYADKEVVLTHSKTAQSFSPSQILGDRGAVTVGSVSQVKDVRFYDAATSECETVFGDMSKVGIMEYEAADFMRFEDDPVNTAGDYAHCREMSLLVCETLAEMRRQAPGFTF